MKDIIFTLEFGSEWVPDIYYPVPASKEIPEWYKKMKTSNHGDDLNVRETSTIKRCMPVFDVITAGYIIKTFTDLTVKRGESGALEFLWAYDTSDSITFHGGHQLENYKELDMSNGAPKLRNPWSIKTPPGYSCLFIAPVHRPKNGIHILEGIVDTDTYVNTIQFPFMIDEGFEGTIPAGTPVVQVIPFKREEFKMQFGGNKERNEIHIAGAKLRSKWINGYKNLFRAKKSYT